MIVGLDEKVLWDDDGKPMLAPHGKDPVLIVDLANPESPKIVSLAAAEEFGRRPAGQCRHRPDRLDRAGGGLGRCRQGWRRAEAGAGQQDLRHRPQGEPAQAGGDHDRRQAAVGAEHQPVRQDGAGRQSRRQFDQRALDQRHRRQGHRHDRDARQRLACDVHAGRQAGAGGAVSRRTRCRCSTSPATR